MGIESIISKECKWCNAKNTINFCSDECREKFYSFAAFARKYIKLFIILIIVCPFAFIPISAFIDHDSLFFFGAMFLFLGVTITALSFCTTQTVELLGLRRSIIAGRICGIVMIVISLPFIL